MLRLALLENTRRIAARIELGLKDRTLAGTWGVAADLRRRNECRPI